MFDREETTIFLVLEGRSEQYIEDVLRETDPGYYNAIEFRWDFGKLELAALGDMIKAVRKLRNIPLLLTLRTEAEGGRANILKEKYVDLLKGLIYSGIPIDAVDIEYFVAGNELSALLKSAKQKHIETVVSIHKFDGTPKIEDCIEILCDLEAGGAHICKLATLIDSAEDMDILYKFGTEAKKRSIKPILVAMGHLGRETRAFPEKINSIATYGVSKEIVAPGQLTLAEINNLRFFSH